MEKCPPAEACKDAFERMSKATVQMCMSTTGFGLDAKSSRQRPRSEVPTQASFTSTGSETNYPNPNISRQYQSPQQERQVKTRRPPPKFDMNLRDLFPDDINHDDLASQSYVRQPQPQFQEQQNQPFPVQPQRLSRQYSFPQQEQSLNNQINAGLGMNANQASAGSISQHRPQLQQQQQQQTTQQTQGNPPPTSPFYNTSPYGVDLTNVPGLDFLQSTGYNQPLDTTGIDLGFGPGMDFQHDWSDGNGVDIFDGFFFGNGAG